jgi:ABC-type sugar transport system ATPase subunit
MARLTLRSVWKTYGQLPAVKGVSLEVDEGQLIALLGPSGCGKTSTLKMVAGLEDVSSGHLYFDDRLMNHVAPENRDVAMVFEDYSLYPRMNVAQNIVFPLRIRGMGAAERRRRVEEMLELLELRDVATASVRELSGGQQQRVAIARALVREPAVLLFDEPLSHLDHELKVRLRNQIRWLQQRKSVTSVLVTHDQAEALALADMVAVMHLGELRQYGTPFEVYRRPHDMFVAGFIGEPPMNFLPCRLEVSDGVVRAEAEGYSVALRGGPSAALLDSGLDPARSFVLGVRPEDLHIASGEGEACGRGEVFFSEWRGEYQVLLISKPGVTAHWLTLLAPPDASFPIGEAVPLTTDPDAVHIFDAETQRNVAVELGDGRREAETAPSEAVEASKWAHA